MSTASQKYNRKIMDIRKDRKNTRNKSIYNNKGPHTGCLKKKQPHVIPEVRRVFK